MTSVTPQADAPASVPAPEIAPAQPPPPTAKPGDPMIAFAYACLRHELESLLAHRPLRDELPTPESVHQMRIATRRLRIALRMFRHMLPKDAGERIQKDLRWFARALGEVRDLDVYTDNFRAYQQAIPPDQQQDLGGYELHLRRARAEARNKLGALFTDERYAKLIVSFGEFLDGAPSAAALRRWRSFRVSDGFKKYLRKSAKRVRQLGRKIGSDARPKKLHRLRIRAKRLRYELEFFVEVLPALQRVAKATKALQDMLGEHQDACTATERLEDYAAALQAQAGEGQPAPAALEHLLAIQRRKAEEARKAFTTEWRKFEKTIARTKLAA
jgi:CHAD domain-containing protein